MKVLIKEKLSPHKSKTPEGYLICRDAILGRTGAQDYYANEIYADSKDDRIVKVMRDAKEVFSPETIASFENKPVTCEHPEEDVTPDNFKQYSVGFARDIHQGRVDGEDVLLGNLIITDPETINDIENDIRTELSCGYTCDITDDENPRQINIRGNHIALCEKGRAGNARIVDSLDGEKKGKLPTQLKNKISVELGKLSTYVHNPEYEVYDFIKEVEQKFAFNENPIKFTRESIGPWRKMGDGMMRKDYVFSVDGYDNSIIVSLYAKPDTWETTEVNSYFRDSASCSDKYDPEYTKHFKQLENDAETLYKEYQKGNRAPSDILKELGYQDFGGELVGKYVDNFTYLINFDDDEFIKYYVLKDGRIPSGYTVTKMRFYDELIESKSEEAFKKNVATEIKAGKDPKQAVAIAHSIKRKAKDSETYRGYDIDFDEDEEVYKVTFDGSEMKFGTSEEAHNYVDEMLALTKAMLRDRAIRDRDYSPEFNEEMRKIFARAKNEIEDEEAPDDKTRKLFRKTKNRLIKHLKEKLQDLHE